MKAGKSKRTVFIEMNLRRGGIEIPIQKDGKPALKTYTTSSILSCIRKLLSRGRTTPMMTQIMKDLTTIELLEDLLVIKVMEGLAVVKFLEDLVTIKFLEDSAALRKIFLLFLDLLFLNLLLKL